MYAIVKTGGKQYRVEQGSSLLVERLRADEGAKVSLEPLLFVDGDKIVDDGKGVTVQAQVVAHERGPKLRVVKFKPKRGYKRRTGHRQELTRLEVTSIKGPAARKPRAKAESADKPTPGRQASSEKPAPRRRTSTDKPAPRRRTSTDKPAPRRRTSTEKKESASDGS
jgi:large subunit ribosomal protein L21